MNIAEEKNYCYSMMKDITDERRRLSEMYMSLKTRVDELNRLEEKGVEELSTKGFFDMFNDRETHIQITNINRETESAIKTRHVEIEKDIPKPRYDKAESTIFETKLEKEKRLADKEREQKAAENLRVVADNLISEMEAKKEVAATTQPTIPLAEIEKTKDEEARKYKMKPTTSKRGPKPGTPRGRRVETGLSTNDASGYMEEILKLHGKPMHREELYKIVVQKSGAHQLTLQNFANNILLRVTKMNPKIVRSQNKGFYEYKK